MKKFFAILLSIVLMLSLAVPAMAADTYTLTLNGAQAGHTYAAYQIFAGDLSGDTLSNIKWGSGVNTTAQGFNLGDAATKAESLKTTADAEAFAAAVAPYLSTAAGSVTIANEATSGDISGLTAGYYLVKTTATSDNNDVYTYYIMKIVKDTFASIKADVPEVDKTVDDSDANIGDTVTFTLTATMPSNIQGYETYKVIFHDTLSAGLDFVEGSVSVKIGEKDITGSFTPDEKDGILTITCNNVLAEAVGATANTVITVTYEAILDADAVIGTDGNLNKVYLEYSNNPNAGGEGETGNTPEEEVKVYTWEIPVFKFTKDGDTNKPLAGAGFTLYTDADCTMGVELELKADSTNVYLHKKTNTTAAKGTEITTDATGKFEIHGLAQGTYYLKETTTPAGYNTCDVVTVVIGENGALTQDNQTTTEVGILNQAGATLPETGGMGTTIFYIVGGVMVAAAVVLLITKKRMSAEG